MDENMSKTLPDEILEIIFRSLAPYSDLRSCSLVCKQWNRVAKSTYRYGIDKLYSGLRGSALLQCTTQIHDIAPSRRSHVATCVVGDYLYAFGGSFVDDYRDYRAAFNDLWKMNLSSRKWERIIPTGQYPKPRFCANLVHHDGNLILYGGRMLHRSHSVLQGGIVLLSVPINEIHVFQMESCRWISDYRTLDIVPHISMYGVTEHKGMLVVTGGHIHSEAAIAENEHVWCYCIESGDWTKRDVEGPKPGPRRKHTQVKLDDDHLLLIGGVRIVRGTDNDGQPQNDCWMLDMSQPDWKWILMTVDRPAENSLLCSNHRGCKVGDNLVFLHPKCSMNIGGHRCGIIRVQRRRNPGLDALHLPHALEPHGIYRIPLEINNQNDRNVIRAQPDVNVNGRRGELCQDRTHTVRGVQPYPAVVRSYQFEKKEYFAYSLDLEEAIVKHTVRWRKSLPFWGDERLPVLGFSVDYGAGEIIVTGGLPLPCFQSRCDVDNRERSYFIAHKSVLS